MDDAALYDWDEAIRLQPANVDFVVSKVDILLRQGRRKEAREALDAVTHHGVVRGMLKEWYDRCK